MKFLGLILLILSFNISLAAELEAEFVFNNEVSEIREGDVVNATLRIWPIENFEKNEIEKLSSQVLFESFYVASFSSISPSENNADVIEAKGTFVALKKTNPENLNINYAGQSIRVKFKEVLFIPNTIKETNFQILSQSDVYNNLKYIIWVIVLVFAFFVFYFKDNLKMRFQKNPKIDPKQRFKEKFISAKSRQDFEEIYNLKETWLPLLEVITPSHKEFFNVLNQYQYKKEWDTREKDEVVESFEAIRRSFE